MVVANVDEWAGKGWVKSEKNMKETITKIDIENAYRKLKSYLYYDNFSILLRQKLAEFEDFEKLDVVFERLSNLLNNINSNENITYFESLLSQITYSVVPKSFLKDDLDEDFIITNNFSKSHYNIDKVNYLISAPIEIHLISVVWIMKEGYVLSKGYKKNNYAYALETDPNTNNIVDGLRLFKPYFEQYQKWRDRSIETALKFIEQDTDVVIVGLDIKEYYYNINFDAVIKTNLKDEIKKELNIDLKETVNLITDLIFQINDKFTTTLKTDGYKKDCSNFIPIGLLSSGILSNWYLNEFDKEILDKLSPAFYGRYVDDILIVLANTKIPDYKEHEKFISSMELFFDKYFTQRDIFEESYPPFKQDRLKDVDKNLVKIKNQLDSYTYSWTQKKEIKIQKSKLSLHSFNSRESKAILEQFKINIQKNSSAFWFLPDDTELNKSFDESVYELTYSDTVNKLRSVSDIKQSKYGASIFLAKKIKLSLLASQKYDEKTKEQILTFFKGRMNLEFSSVWEKVLTYFVINNDKDSFWKFLFETYSSISRISIQKDRKDISIIKLQNDLLDFLCNTCAMAIALNPNFLNDRIISKFSSIEKISLNNIIDYSNNFRKSNMFRHNLVATPIINYTNSINNDNCNLIEFKKQINSDLEQKKLRFSPRYIYFIEFCVFFNLKRITSITPILTEQKEYNISNLFFDEKEGNSVLDEAFELYYNSNYILRKNLNSENEQVKLEKIKFRDTLFKITNGDKNDIYSNCISVPNSDRLRKNFSISIANIKIEDSNIFASIVGSPNTSESRSSQLIKILNHTEEVKADALILPEVSFPFKYLFQIADESRRKQRMIIVGLEHLEINNICFNFIATCLPFEINGIKDVLIVLRLKNHYSPNEENLIIDSGKIVPKSNPATYNLFKWRDLCFSVYNCYELADINHRSIFKSKVDALFASEYNQDVNYFSNIVESITRDVHCYFIQANNSNFGDSRITAPVNTERKDILRLKGGENDVVLLGNIDIKELREFQATRLRGQDTRKFKNTPPNYIHEEAESRLGRKINK